MLESKFETQLVRYINELFPGSVILKNDTRAIQGIPDRTILYKDRWAVLEFKRSEDAPRQPNQEYYIDLLNRMSFGAFVYPENAEEVVDALQRAFESRR